MVTSMFRLCIDPGARAVSIKSRIKGDDKVLQEEGEEGEVPFYEVLS